MAPTGHQRENRCRLKPTGCTCKHAETTHVADSDIQWHPLLLGAFQQHILLPATSFSQSPKSRTSPLCSNWGSIHETELHGYWAMTLHVSGKRKKQAKAKSRLMQSKRNQASKPSQCLNHLNCATTQGPNPSKRDIHNCTSQMHPIKAMTIESSPQKWSTEVSHHFTAHRSQSPLIPPDHKFRKAVNKSAEDGFCAVRVSMQTPRLRCIVATGSSASLCRSRSSASWNWVLLSSLATVPRR